MQRCPNCGGGELKTIAAIVERAVIEKILKHLGSDSQLPGPDTGSPVDSGCLPKHRRCRHAAEVVLGGQTGNPLGQASVLAPPP